MSLDVKDGHGVIQTIRTDLVSGAQAVSHNIRKLTLIDDFASVSGDVVHDAPDIGNPISVGGFAQGVAYPTPVAFGDRTRAWYDLYGRQVTVAGGKEALTLLPSAARTTVATTAQQNIYVALIGVTLWFKVTAVAGSPSLVVSLECGNPIDGSFISVASFTAVTGTGSFLYQVCPGIDAVAGSRVAFQMSRSWRAVVTPGTADSCTYSLGGEVCI